MIRNEHIETYGCKKNVQKEFKNDKNVKTWQ